MQFCGIYEYFAYERPQVIGKVEMAYLEKLSSAEKQAVLERFYAYRIPCVIICRGMDPPPELLEAARNAKVWLFRTGQRTTRFCFSAIVYLNRCLAPHESVHGVLLDVYWVGVLLRGKSGVGKSEAALELIKRGHMLVADDLVDICRIADDRLIGTCPESIRNMMEIRGIGVIDIRAVYGIGAVCPSKTIDLIMELEPWEEGKMYDRIGYEEHTIKIMEVPVPYMTMPVKPGRNLAIIVEVAARNLSLKRTGYHAAKELVSQLSDHEV
jgi:HPr kinase/phosphorylase